MTYFLSKKNSPLRRAIFQIFGHKTQIKEETAQNIEKMPFSKIGTGILRTLSLIENFMKHIKFLKISSKPLYSITHTTTYLKKQKRC
jgi:hypothetical protein